MLKSYMEQRLLSTLIQKLDCYFLCYIQIWNKASPLRQGDDVYPSSMQSRLHIIAQLPLQLHIGGVVVDQHNLLHIAAACVQHAPHSTKKHRQWLVVVDYHHGGGGEVVVIRHCGALFAAVVYGKMN